MAENTTSATGQDRVPDGSDPLDFLRDNRINLRDGSLFVDAAVVLHPRELDPANEDRLREKLTRIYRLNDPSFFDDVLSGALANQMAQLVPASLGTKRETLVSEVEKFNAQVDSRQDTDLARAAQDMAHPFAALAREQAKLPPKTPLQVEQAKNGIAMLLMLRDALTRNGYLRSMTELLREARSPEQILQDLSPMLGVTSEQLIAAAREGGLEQLAALLAVDEKTLADIRAVTDRAAQNNFSNNLLVNWGIGRRLKPDAPLDGKIEAGLTERVTADIGKFRERVKQQYDVPELLRPEEKRVAQMLDILAPVQRKLLYKLGYDVCYSPDVLTDRIAFFNGLYGGNRRVTNRPDDLTGAFHLYFAATETLENSMRTLAHEVAHNIWPSRMDKAELAEMDRLAASDAQRFGQLKKLVDERYGELSQLVTDYHAAADDAGRAAVIQRAEGLFKPYGLDAGGLLPNLKDVHELTYLVSQANDWLDVTGSNYTKVHYDTPQVRIGEVVSRFAELKQVRFRTQPELLRYVAPGLDELFDKHYLPHLEKIYASLDAKEAPQAGAAEAEKLAMANATTAASPQALAMNTPRAAGLPALAALKTSFAAPAL